MDSLTGVRLAEAVAAVELRGIFKDIRLETKWAPAMGGFEIALIWFDVPNRDDPTDKNPLCFRWYWSYRHVLSLLEKPEKFQELVKQRLLSCVEHEMLESLYFSGVRVFDPHRPA